MTRSVSGRVGSCLLLTAIVLLASPGRSASPAEDPRDVKIAKALQTPTNLEFINTPLRDVVKYLQDLHDLKIQIDSKALETTKISVDAPITKKSESVPFGKALGEILAPLKLDYIVKDHVLTITTAEAAKEWKKAKAKENKQP